jgi:hypothetical protein
VNVSYNNTIFVDDIFLLLWIFNLMLFACHSLGVDASSANRLKPLLMIDL